MSPIYRLRLATLHSLPISPLLVMTNFYMPNSLTASLTKFLSSVALLSLTAQRHCICVHILLQREKTHLQREGVKTHRETHMVQVVQIQKEMHQVHFIFCWMVLSEMLRKPLNCLRLINSRRILPQKWSKWTTNMAIHPSIAFNTWLTMVSYQSVWTIFLFLSTRSYYTERQPKCPRKTKTEKSINDSKPVVSVGDCVFFNVLVSSTPDLIAHISLFIMRLH